MVDNVWRAARPRNQARIACVIDKRITSGEGTPEYLVAREPGCGPDWQVRGPDWTPRERALGDEFDAIVGGAKIVRRATITTSTQTTESTLVGCTVRFSKQDFYEEDYDTSGWKQQECGVWVGEIVSRSRAAATARGGKKAQARWMVHFRGDASTINLGPFTTQRVRGCMVRFVPHDPHSSTDTIAHAHEPIVLTETGDNIIQYQNLKALRISKRPAADLGASLNPTLNRRQRLVRASKGVQDDAMFVCSNIPTMIFGEPAVSCAYRSLVLEAVGADVQHADVDGRTALMCAENNGSEVVGQLVIAKEQCT